MFKKVDTKQSFPKMEEEILKFWEENKIFEKSVEKNSADKSFVFYYLGYTDNNCGIYL